MQGTTGGAFIHFMLSLEACLVMKTIRRFFVFLLAGLFAAGLAAAQGLTDDRKQQQEPKKQLSTKERSRTSEKGMGTVVGGNGRTGVQVHRDGTAFAKESRVTQADRQAAAKRAKEKGFEAQLVEISTESSLTTEADKGAKK